MFAESGLLDKYDALGHRGYQMMPVRGAESRTW